MNRISLFCAVILLILSAIKLYAQDTIFLEAAECAIVKFQLQDDCPCSNFTLELRNGQLENERLVLVSIDSVILIHIADNFIDKEYLVNDIRYLLLTDSTMKLRRDTSYIASVALHFDMNYVILVELYGENLVYIENPYGRTASFSFAIPPEPDQSSAGAKINNWSQIKRSIDECNTKYGFEVKRHHKSSD